MNRLQLRTLIAYDLINYYNGIKCPKIRRRKPIEYWNIYGHLLSTSQRCGNLH
ncbi:hypothetical protein LSAJ18_70023 [Latilactobacillus sakei]|nr:hypothetical protein LSAJ18_70023 [Latilactobacillus sakei]SON70746.1 protein of unknown function [Latilactobacillus sakei]